MTEQEIERCLERLATCKATDVMNFDYAGTLAYIKRLKAENVVLRERLEKAVELPCKVGDTLYELFADSIIREYVVESIFIHGKEIDVNCQKKDDYKWHSRFVIGEYCNDFGSNGKVCLTHEAPKPASRN